MCQWIWREKKSPDMWNPHGYTTTLSPHCHYWWTDDDDVQLLLQCPWNAIDGLSKSSHYYTFCQFPHGCTSTLSPKYGLQHIYTYQYLASHSDVAQRSKSKQWMCSLFNFFFCKYFWSINDVLIDTTRKKKVFSFISSVSVILFTTIQDFLSQQNECFTVKMPCPSHKTCVLPCSREVEAMRKDTRFASVGNRLK